MSRRLDLDAPRQIPHPGRTADKARKEHTMDIKQMARTTLPPPAAADRAIQAGKAKGRTLDIPFTISIVDAGGLP
jgi:hypothetical protein